MLLGVGEGSVRDVFYFCGNCVYIVFDVVVVMRFFYWLLLYVDVIGLIIVVDGFVFEFLCIVSV